MSATPDGGDGGGGGGEQDTGTWARMEAGSEQEQPGVCFFNLLCDFRTIAFPRWVFLFLAEVPPGLSQVFHVEQGAFPFGLGGGGVICLLLGKSRVIILVSRVLVPCLLPASCGLLEDHCCSLGLSVLVKCNGKVSSRLPSFLRP